MTEPFYLRLKEYYSKVGAVLRGEASSASIFPNPTDIGMSRERVYAEILKLHLPSSCNVLYGGFLFGMDGTESRQIDLIITNDLTLQFNFHNRDGSGKSFACIDGTIAVVLIKSTLDSKELVDALQNLASIPAKLPLGNRFVPSLRKLNGYDDWPHKIIYASDGIALKSIEQTLHKYYQDNPQIPYECRPNLIHVAGKYIIDRSSFPRKMRNDLDIPANSFHGVEETTDVCGLFLAFAQCQRIALFSRHIDYSYGEMLDDIPF
jgi:hypothetical protein